MGETIATNFQLTGGGKVAAIGAPDKISCIGNTSLSDASRTVTRNRSWYNSRACPSLIMSRPAFVTSPAFRLKDGALAINREIAQHRFLRSTAPPMFPPLSGARAIAPMIACRCSITRATSTGFAQVDSFLSDGSSHVVYALADAERTC